MHLRPLTWISLGTALAIGGGLRPGLLSGDTGRLLITFVGLLSASLLPTISLILGSMTASGRSVLAINRLNDELTAAMDALFALFGLIAVTVAAMIAMTIPTPQLVADIPFVADGLARGGQALVAATTTLVVMRAGQIPGILRRALAIRHEIAVDEARRKAIDNAPTQDDLRDAFRTHPEFGKTVTLQDLQGREPH